MKHIAAVILNYNSEHDLRICAEHIAQQQGVRLSLILVDNASQPEKVAAIREWLVRWRPDAIGGTEDKVHDWVRQHPEEIRQSSRIYFVENHENRGYSAGNNIGIRLADTLDAEAVLLANPDMRFENRDYLNILATHLLSDPQNSIAASRIIDLAGVDQNPLREASFLEELFWPRSIFRKFLSPQSYVIPSPVDKSVHVPKVSGCCLMLRMKHIREVGYLDDRVFLYCEEPILAARVRQTHGRILYVPTIEAVHAHVKSDKGNQTRRMLQFITSRKYYLAHYSGYVKWQVWLLGASYALLAGYSRVKGLFFRLADRGHDNA